MLVMVVLTDGRANPVPISAAEDEAARAKGAGVVLFTVGLGHDLDTEALARMASRPGYFHLAADAEALVRIYRAIAVAIPCPSNAFWGRRVLDSPSRPSYNVIQMPTLLLKRLVWDAWNVEHIARHGATPEDVTVVCLGEVIVRQSYQGRLLIIGPNSKGRIVAVVLAPQAEQGVYYPITARVADAKEQRLYKIETGGNA
jgi:uncharacterized DUF497 family protein